jgi:hypothetical protein
MLDNDHSDRTHSELKCMCYPASESVHRRHLKVKWLIKHVKCVKAVYCYPICV